MDNIQFWKPGTVKDSDDLDVMPYNKNNQLSIEKQKLLLPITNHKHQICEAIEKNDVVIIIGQTGSGKTTQIPQFLYETGWGEQGYQIACTQPRRIAAITVAERVAFELGEKIGGTVGYNVRFDDKTDYQRTKIKFLTDGILIREMMSDPLLKRYSVVMVDEAHERSVQTDLVLGLLKKIQKRRLFLSQQSYERIVPLKIIVSSATIDIEQFQKYFKKGTSNKIELISVQGRQYDVSVFYKSIPCSNYVQEAVTTATVIHKTEPAGDILIFLTGQNEIEQAINMFEESNSRIMKEVVLLPMYSGLSYHKQHKVFSPAPRGVRKIIFATNIAETSITIDGIIYVVDCGFVKIKRFDPVSSNEQLVIVPISKANAAQRTGRAGRVKNGRCYRLYTQNAFEKLDDKSEAEIERCNLSFTFLQLKALGVDDVVHFHYLTPPSTQSTSKALEILYLLGAIDDQSKLTNPLGTNLAELPCDSPFLSKMLLKSLEMGCTKEIVTIAAMLSVQNIFVSHKGAKQVTEKARGYFSVVEGDHFTLMNIYNSFIFNKKSKSWCQSLHLNYKALVQAANIRKQYLSYLKRFGDTNSSTEDLSLVSKCIISGYFVNAAVLQKDGSFYHTIRGNFPVYIHPTSVYFHCSVFPRYVVFFDILYTNRPYMNHIIEINPDFLSEYYNVK